MGETRAYADLAAKLAALEERMKTQKAEHETAIERLRGDLATRDRQMLTTIAAFIVGAVVILGVLIRL